jgi:hypothetical protein
MLVDVPALGALVVIGLHLDLVRPSHIHLVFSQDLLQVVRIHLSASADPDVGGGDEHETQSGCDQLD